MWFLLENKLPCLVIPLNNEHKREAKMSVPPQPQAGVHAGTLSIAVVLIFKRLKAFKALKVGYFFLGETNFINKQSGISVRKWPAAICFFRVFETI